MEGGREGVRSMASPCRGLLWSSEQGGLVVAVYRRRRRGEWCGDCDVRRFICASARSFGGWVFSISGGVCNFGSDGSFI